MNRSLPALQRIVVKIGSSSLCEETGKIDKQQIIELTRQISRLRALGYQVILVSSGAIAAGMNWLNGISVEIQNKQAAAAIGQPLLMGYFQQHFQAYGLHTAQVLLTHDDFQSRRRYLNARNTINSLLNHGLIPIINENDTITTEEIRFSDNDFLGALCTNLVSADLYIILSNIDGIADKNPRKHPGARIYEALSVSELENMKKTFASETSQGFGRGGILTKLEAPLMAAQYGVPTIVANSRTKNILTRIIEGEALGTFVQPTETQLNSWQAFIAHAIKPKAIIVIDAGAAKAIRSKKASLLASGIISTRGSFQRGDGVRCCLEDGTEISRGIVEYNKDDVKKIAGKQSAEIEALLGFCVSRGVIHRENMVIG